MHRTTSAHDHTGGLGRRGRSVRRWTASAVALATVATGFVAESADAGSVVRLWTAPATMDDTLLSLAPAATAHFGTQAAAVWVTGGHAWLSERSALTGQWGARQDIGATTGVVDVDYGTDGTLGVAVGQTFSANYGVRVYIKAPGGSLTARTTGVNAQEVAPVAATQIVMTGAVATVAWLQGGPTGSVRLATSTGRTGDLEVLGTFGPGPIARYSLMDRGTQPPALLWLGDTSKPNARVRAVVRGAGVVEWPVDGSAATLLTPDTASVKDFRAAGADDGTSVVAYLVATSDPVPGAFTLNGTATGSWSSPVHLDGTTALSHQPSVDAGNGGAAVVVWRNDVPLDSNDVFVVDRSSSAVAWPAPTELVYLCAGCGDDPNDDPLVMRGKDGTSLVMWLGYGATAGSVVSFVGKGTSWAKVGGLFSDDTDRPGEPLVLDDGTTVVIGAVRRFFVGTEFALQVTEGSLYMTGPSAGGPASMTGTARVGGRLVCTPPAFAPLPASVTYAWLRNGAAITGATSSAYAPVAADLGKSLQCKVTGTITGPLAGSTAVLSNAATIAIGLAPKASLGSVAVLGVHKVGVKQTCRLGTWSPTATYSYTVRWLRDGVLIAGATASTYTPPLSMRGHRLACRVTAARAGYTTGVATSANVIIG